jgi:hypothetical protein
MEDLVKIVSYGSGIVISASETTENLVKIASPSRPPRGAA